MKKTKLSDYVADFLAGLGIRHVFVISGGASIHLLHSVAQHPSLTHVCPHHEQGAAMAADAYARVGGGLGCAVATSGPGATNMITGIAGAWFDSVPVLYITGQVTTFRMKGDTGVRQLGFQETEIIPMVQPITKYAVQIRDAKQIRYELEKAVHMAIAGRPGPVVIDIPDDLQREHIDVSSLPGFVPEKTEAKPTPPQDQVAKVAELIRKASRPVLILGWGVYLSGAADKARELADRLGFPVLTTWGGKSLLPANDKNLAGTFGTHGTRAGNFTMQNADLVISIGARMSTRETGSPMESWAREAKIVMVDIDPAELRKFPSFGKPIDVSVRADAGEFIAALLARNLQAADIAPWCERIRQWKERYPVTPADARTGEQVHPYAFVESLSASLPEREQVLIDTGCAVAWLMQAGLFTKGQRLYHDFNNTAMGWALPAAIGGCLAMDGKPVTCVVGDGSFMMNVQELATVKHFNLPVRIFVLNNKGYGMVRQTEEQWLDGNHAGTSADDLFFPDFCKLAEAHDIPAIRIERNAEVEPKIVQALGTKGPVLVEVVLPVDGRVIPQSKFGYPIEDSEPLLPRDEFISNMIVKPAAKSLEPLK
jgi:acetolactate synthase-1/2/3 large subunit